VAFDKTGTLTEGRPELTDFVAYGLAREAALRLVASAEAGSEHPIARAVVQAAEREGLDLARPSAFAAEAGRGIVATVEGREVRVGTRRWLAELGVDVGPAEEEADALAAQARSPVFVAVDGALAALFAVADPIKASTAEALEQLRAQGLALAMLTGDGAATANAIAKKLGIDTVKSEVLPADKEAAVRDLQASGRKVAFVGDGINDAPALARADVGVALGTGTDIAIEAGQVIAMSGDVRGVANAIALSRRTLRTIRMNFFWAYAYNVALIPVAAGVLYPLLGVLLSPMLAAGAMSLSSVFVVTNSLRLRRFTPKWGTGTS
jgi:Cu+-exporting ATPase